MRCPCCGSPVMIYGDRWECGYCGDSGFLSGICEEIDLTVSVDLDPDLPRIRRVLNGCTAGFEDPSLPWKGLAYEISLALGRSPVGKLARLDALLSGYPEIPASREQFRRGAEQGSPLFYREGILNETDLGSFWKALIETHRGQEPEAVSELLWAFAKVFQYLSCTCYDGTDFKEESRLEQLLGPWWRGDALTHPEEDRAVAALRAGNDGFADAHLRDLLFLGFPQLFADFTREQMEHFLFCFFLQDLWRQDPKQAETCWQYLQKKVGTFSPELAGYLSYSTRCLGKKP